MQSLNSSFATRSGITVPIEIPNYTLLSKLGEGAMAEVWLATHKRNGRKAAIKILKPAANDNGDFEKLFQREGQVLASFDHPNIVKIYDNDRVGDSAYLAMECLTGGTLFERMQRAPITIGEALGLVAQIASGLDAAHRQQVVHRDLKPANIMLRDETTPVLTDFGASRLLDRSTIYGRDGMIVGTPIYMSPEQVSGQSLSGSSDLYALGVIFHELLTGDRPFPGVSFPEIASQHLFAPIPRLPASIAMLQPVLDRLLAKKPQDRYASAQALVDELRSIFVADEALRQQVGYAGTSMAWSSQLRALGFVLDREQKLEIRLAQGDFLRAQAAPIDQPTAPAPRIEGSRAPGPAMMVEVQKKPRRSAIALGALLAVVLLSSGWWWTQQDAPNAPAMVIAPSVEPMTPAEPDPIALGDDDLPAVSDAAAQSDDDEPATSGAATTQSDGDEPSAASDDDAASLAEAVQAITALELRIRFTALPDGNVSDSKTGLIWAAKDNAADIDWYDATRLCKSMGAGWELPSPSELISLFDETGTLKRTCGESTCNVTALVSVSERFYWTRSADTDSRAWVVDLSNGARLAMAIVNPFYNRALCVRQS